MARTPGPADLDEYVAALGRLYRAIAEVSGASVVIDNSKQVAAALVVRRVPGVDLRLLHLVRSPHGVAYSWTKHVSRGDMGGNEMRRRGPGRTALRWDADNLLFERLGRAGTPRLLLRYEDFVTDARGSTTAVLDFLDEPADELDYVGPDWADLGVEHSVWGNPMRGREGREQLRPDEGWRTGLAQRDARLVSALDRAGARTLRRLTSDAGPAPLRRRRGGSCGSPAARAARAARASATRPPGRAASRTRPPRSPRPGSGRAPAAPAAG